eukprot:753987-Rhodomonas_salina.1
MCSAVRGPEAIRRSTARSSANSKSSELNEDKSASTSLRRSPKGFPGSTCQAPRDQPLLTRTADATRLASSSPRF